MCIGLLNDSALYSNINVRFTEDGNRIVVTSKDKTCRIFDIKTKKCILSYTENTIRGQTVHHPTRPTLCLVSETWNNVHIKDWGHGVSIATLEGHSSNITSASFSPNGRHIVSSSDSTIHIWEFPPLQELINKTHEQFKNRKLTPGERRRYHLEK